MPHLTLRYKWGGFTQQDQALLNEVEAAGVYLHPQLERLVLQAAVEVVKDAIAVVKEAKAKGSLKNPAGLLIEAIKNQWKPTQQQETTTTTDDDYSAQFEEWYEKAIISGLVQAVPIKLLSKDRCGQPLVRWRKPGSFGAPYTLIPWRELWTETPQPTATPEAATPPESS